MRKIEGLETKSQLTFSDGTRQLMIRATESAFSLNHNYVGTEHLLLASLQDPLIAGFIKTFPNGNPERIKNSVLFMIGRGERLLEGVINLTPRAKKVVELAADEARMQGKTQVEPSDVLLGMIREGEGVAAGVLDNINMKFNNITVIRKGLKKFSENFKKLLSDKENVISERAKVIVRHLRVRMIDPNLSFDKKNALLIAIEAVMRVTQSPQEKT